MLAISFLISLLACEIRLFAASRSLQVALHALCQQMGQSLGGALTWSPPHTMMRLRNLVKRGDGLLGRARLALRLRNRRRVRR